MIWRIASQIRMQKNSNVKDNFLFSIVTKLTIKCHILECTHSSSPRWGLYVTVWGWGAPVVMPRLRLRDWLWLRSGSRSGCVWLRSRRLHTTFTMITAGAWPAPLSLSWPWQLGSVMLAFNPGSGLMVQRLACLAQAMSCCLIPLTLSLGPPIPLPSQPPQNTPQPQQSQSWVWTVDWENPPDLSCRWWA